MNYKMILKRVHVLTLLFVSLKIVTSEEVEKENGRSYYMHLVESADNDNDDNTDFNGNHDADEDVRHNIKNSLSKYIPDKYGVSLTDNGGLDIDSLLHSELITGSKVSQNTADNGDKKDDGAEENDGLLESIYKLLKDKKHHIEHKQIENEEVREIYQQSLKATSKRETNPCGTDQPLVVNDASGAIMSPGFFNGRYDHNVKCSWKFVAPVGKVVKVKFQVMDIEKSNECGYDSVQVWDVKESKGFRLAKYCGRSLPMELLESTGNYLFVYFVTDESGGVGRFSFQWDFIDPMPPEPHDRHCGSPAIQPSLTSRIVNGKPAVAHSWPWQVSIRRVINGKQYHICGGSIISKTVILTAAHCFFDKYHKRIADSSIRVVAGDHDQTTRRDGPTQSPRVGRVVVHRYYNAFSASSPYDIAVILLSSALVMNKHVGTICLARDDPRIDDECFATGWGDTEGTGDETVLNQVKLPIVSQAICRQGNHYGSKIVDSVLCAGFEEGGKDACQGDSGGPLVCLNRLNGRWYLQGITSWGAGCGKAHKPGIYTRVDKYLNWIYNKCQVIS